MLATATCYVEIGEGVTGGQLEFARQAEHFVDEPEVTSTVQPRSGTLVTFHNTLLQHRVHAMSGRGARLLLAFHLVDPAHRQAPAAAELPRLHERHSLEELQGMRDASRRCRLDVGRRVRQTTIGPWSRRRATTGLLPRRGTTDGQLALVQDDDDDDDDDDDRVRTLTGVSVPTDDDDGDWRPMRQTTGMVRPMRRTTGFGAAFDPFDDFQPPRHRERVRRCLVM